MLADNKYFFIQFKLKDHRDAFINGELRITQQQYYRHLSSVVSDSSEGEQMLHANGEIFILYGNHSTYIWSCSVVEKKDLSNLKKFGGYDFGLLILEPEVFVNQVRDSLESTQILKNCADVTSGPVIYTDKGLPLTVDKDKQLSRWTKPIQFSDEFEYRLCVHNVPPIEIIVEFLPNEVYRIEEVFTPNEKVQTKQTFYRLVFNIAFDFSYELYNFDGNIWVRESLW